MDQSMEVDQPSADIRRGTIPVNLVLPNLVRIKVNLMAGFSAEPSGFLIVLSIINLVTYGRLDSHALFLS